MKQVKRCTYCGKLAGWYVVGTIANDYSPEGEPEGEGHPKFRKAKFCRSCGECITGHITE